MTLCDLSPFYCEKGGGIRTFHQARLNWFKARHVIATCSSCRVYPHDFDHPATVDSIVRALDWARRDRTVAPYDATLFD
jgi:hypothetical protein